MDVIHVELYPSTRSCRTADLARKRKFVLTVSTWRSILLVLLVSTVLSARLASAQSGTGPPSGREGDQMPSSELPDGWRLLRTHSPTGGADAVSIIHPADTSQSDLDLVGLMIRCGENDPEVLIAILSALPAHSRPQVTVGSPGRQFESIVTSPGTLLLLPKDATDLVRKEWQNQQDLSIQIDDGKSNIRGVIKLAGLATAFKTLQANCGAH